MKRLLHPLSAFLVYLGLIAIAQWLMRFGPGRIANDEIIRGLWWIRPFFFWVPLFGTVLGILWIAKKRGSISIWTGTVLCTLAVGFTILDQVIAV